MIQNKHTSSSLLASIASVTSYIAFTLTTVCPLSFAQTSDSPLSGMTASTANTSNSEQGTTTNSTNNTFTLINSSSDSNLSNLNVTQGTTVLVDFGQLNNATLSLDSLTNSGTLYAVSSNPNITSGTFSATGNLVNNALFTSILPANISGVDISSFVSNFSFVINAASLTNNGTLSSAGSLTINTPVFTNNTNAITSAFNNIDINASQVFNSGLISAQIGNINAATASINSSGIMQALNGAINVQNLVGNSLNLTGGNYFSPELNLSANNEILNAELNEVTGIVNIKACEVHLKSNSAILNLGSVDLTGDPSFLNATGSVYLGALNIVGDLAIIAAQDIVASSLNVNPGNNQEGNVWLVAGTSVAQTIPGDVTQASFDTSTSIFIDKTFARSAMGGSIQIAGDITTGGGDVNLVAYGGDNSGSNYPSGAINVGGNITTSGGNVLIIAGSNAGITSIKTGNINTVDNQQHLVHVPVQSYLDSKVFTDSSFYQGNNAGSIKLYTQRPSIIDHLAFQNGTLTHGGFITEGPIALSSMRSGSVETGDLIAYGTVGGGGSFSRDGGGIVFYILDGGKGGDITIWGSKGISVGKIDNYGASGSVSPINFGFYNTAIYYPAPPDGNGTGGAGGTINLFSSNGSLSVNGNITNTGGAGAGVTEFRLIGITSTTPYFSPLLNQPGAGGAINLNIANSIDILGTLNSSGGDGSHLHRGSQGGNISILSGSGTVNISGNIISVGGNYSGIAGNFFMGTSAATSGKVNINGSLSFFGGSPGSALGGSYTGANGGAVTFDLPSTINILGSIVTDGGTGGYSPAAGSPTGISYGLSGGTGGNISLKSRGGDVFVGGNLSSLGGLGGGGHATGSGGNAGNISVLSAGSLTISGVTQSNGGGGGSGSPGGNGGTIQLTAQAGDLQVGSINASGGGGGGGSLASGSYAVGNGGAGGYINLISSGNTKINGSILAVGGGGGGGASYNAGQNFAGGGGGGGFGTFGVGSISQGTSDGSQFGRPRSSGRSGTALLGGAGGPFLSFDNSSFLRGGKGGDLGLPGSPSSDGTPGGQAGYAGTVIINAQGQVSISGATRSYSIDTRGSHGSGLGIIVNAGPEIVNPVYLSDANYGQGANSYASTKGGIISAGAFITEPGSNITLNSQIQSEKVLSAAQINALRIGTTYTIYETLASDPSVITAVQIPPGAFLTPAEYVALVQVITDGVQSIQLSQDSVSSNPGNGYASGGSFTLNSTNSPTSFTNLNLPQNLKIDVQIPNVSYSGNANIDGSLQTAGTTINILGSTTVGNAGSITFLNGGSLSSGGTISGDGLIRANNGALSLTSTNGSIHGQVNSNGLITQASSLSVSAKGSVNIANDQSLTLLQSSASDSFQLTNKGNINIAGNINSLANPGTSINLIANSKGTILTGTGTLYAKNVTLKTDGADIGAFGNPVLTNSSNILVQTNSTGSVYLNNNTSGAIATGLDLSGSVRTLNIIGSGTNNKLTIGNVNAIDSTVLQANNTGSGISSTGTLSTANLSLSANSGGIDFASSNGKIRTNNVTLNAPLATVKIINTASGAINVSGTAQSLTLTATDSSSGILAIGSLSSQILNLSAGSGGIDLKSAGSTNASNLTLNSVNGPVIVNDTFAGIITLGTGKALSYNLMASDPIGGFKALGTLSSNSIAVSAGTGGIDMSSSGSISTLFLAINDPTGPVNITNLAAGTVTTDSSGSVASLTLTQAAPGILTVGPLGINALGHVQLQGASGSNAGIDIEGDIKANSILLSADGTGNITTNAQGLGGGVLNATTVSLTSSGGNIGSKDRPIVSNTSFLASTAFDTLKTGTSVFLSNNQSTTVLNSLASHNFTLSSKGAITVAQNIDVSGINGGRIELLASGPLVTIANSQMPGPAIIQVSPGATIRADGSTGKAGQVVFTPLDFGKVPLQVNVDGFVSATNNTNDSGIVAFNAGLGQNIFLTGSGTVQAGQSNNFGNLAPLSLAPILSPYVGSVNISVARIIGPIIISGLLPTPTHVQAQSSSPNPVAFFATPLPGSSNATISTDTTHLINLQLSSISANSTYVGAVSLTEFENTQTLGSVLLFNAIFDQTTLSILEKNGIIFGPGSGGSYLNLQKGSLLLAPNSDLQVQTKEGIVFVPKGAIVTILETGNDVAVHTLVDASKKRIYVDCKGQKIYLHAGEQVVLTKDQAASFETINPAKGIAWRGITAYKLPDGVRAFVGDFSIISALTNYAPCKSLLKSNSIEAKGTISKILKNAAALQIVTASRGRFQDQ